MNFMNNPMASKYAQFLFNTPNKKVQLAHPQISNQGGAIETKTSPFTGASLPTPEIRFLTNRECKGKCKKKPTVPTIPLQGNIEEQIEKFNATFSNETQAELYKLRIKIADMLKKQLSKKK